MKLFCQFSGAAGTAFTFTLWTGGAAEGAVFILNKMATKNNILAGLGIFTANPEERKDSSSGPRLHICSLNLIILNLTW